MQPTIEVDFREWQKAAKQLKAESSRTLTDFINGQAMAVALQAIKLTKMADRAKIEYQLGAIGTRVRVLSKGKRKGKFVKDGYILKNDSFAKRILVAHYNLTKEWLTPGSTIKEKAEALIKKRLRGIGFIKAGWIPAYKLLTSVVREKPFKASGGAFGVKQIGRPKGSAIPAKNKFGLIFAQIQNDVPRLAKTAEPYAVDGLKKALAFVTRDMMEELARRMKKKMAKNGMR